jgi:chromosome segregation ATPase
MTSQLAGLLPAESTPESGAEAQDPRQRRAIRLGALAAAVAAAADQSQEQGGELRVAMSEVTALDEQITTLTSDKMALEANVGEQEQALTEAEEEIDGLRSDIENLNGQLGELSNRVAELQADLDNSLAGKADVEARLQASTDELAALKQEVGSAKEQLRSLLPGDVITRLVAQAQAEAAPAAEGDVVAAVAEGGEVAAAQGEQAQEAGQ